MKKETSENLSEEVKCLIASNANQWALENYHVVERLRRNVLLASVFGLFVGLSGIKPIRIEMLGVEFDAFSNITFYIVAIFINVYLYWSYYTRCKTAEFQRRYRHGIFSRFFNYDDDIETILKRRKRDILNYRMYIDIIPAIAAALSILAVVVRMVSDLAFADGAISTNQFMPS